MNISAIHLLLGPSKKTSSQTTQCLKRLGIMADFRKLALEYVLSDDLERHASITKEASSGKSYQTLRPKAPGQAEC